MENIRHIIYSAGNGDYDHFNEDTIRRAREELKEMIGCDDTDLNLLLEQLVETVVKTEVVYPGYNS